MTDKEIQAIKVRYGIIGNSPMLGHAIEQATQVAKTKLSVLITGENGVGKDVFSHIIHDYSTAKHGPYFSINCGAIPEGTIESELFGHVKGSFTGAMADHKGYFEVADGGTLFLDEVGELPLSTQARLLRVLENGEFVRVGDSKVQKTHVRIVAATNRNLPQAILDGRFRQDLYYRLNGVEIHLPALRDRREDIPLLFRKFASDFCELNQMARTRLTPEAEELLKNYYWAGNIRQLRNVSEHVCLMETGTEVSAETLRQYLPDNELNRAPAVFGRRSAEGSQGSMSGGMSDNEQALISHMMDAISTMHQRLTDLEEEVNALKHSQTGSLAAGSTIITPMTQPGAIIQKPQESGSEVQIVEEVPTMKQPLTMEETEKESIRLALQRNRNSRKMAAQELQISERTLYRKIKQYGLDQ